MEIVVFQAHPRHGRDEAEYNQTFERMVELAAEVPGFIDIRGFAAEDGSELAVARFDSPEAVDALDGPLDSRDAMAYWSWLDRDAGLVRARVFPIRYGIQEDEATGAAAILLCALVGREIEIRQGRGSILRARPGPSLTVELGGRVELDEVRQL